MNQVDIKNFIKNMWFKRKKQFEEEVGVISLINSVK